MRLANAWKPEKHRLLVFAGRAAVQVKPVNYCFRGQEMFRFMILKKTVFTSPNQSSDLTQHCFLNLNDATQFDGKECPQWVKSHFGALGSGHSKSKSIRGNSAIKAKLKGISVRPVSHLASQAKVATELPFGGIWFGIACALHQH